MNAIASFKKKTANFFRTRLSVALEMRRLQAYFRSVGCCARCQKRLVLDELDRADLPGGWKLEPDALHPGRDHALCTRCAGVHGESHAPVTAPLRAVV